ncbi:MAG: M56 family metallopeptidase [Proteobacteria bacterium]|nr:M56 family metallopeptidase [Pseudomonadota bacterium]
MSGFEPIIDMGLATFLDTIDGLVGALWSVLATGLVHGTVLFAITVMLSSTLLRGARPAVVVALWTVVLIKFAVPVGPEVPVSMSALLSAVMSSADSGDALAGAVLASAANAGEAGPRSLFEVLWLLFQFTLAVLYVGLVARRIGRHASSQRAHRTWAEKLSQPDGRIVAIARRAAGTVGLRRLPELRVSNGLAGPEIIGLLRPIAIVPAHLAVQPSRLEAALVHEFAHLRRGDPWLRALQLGVGAVFFFWPVVGWINRRIDEHREMACDQWAVASGPLDAREYARTLVALARRACGQSLRADPAAVPSRGQDSISLGVVLLLGRRQLEARIDSLLTRKPQPRMGILSVGGLALWVLVSLGGAGSAHAELTPAPECVIHPGVVEYILATYPEADSDGNGELSRDEVCAHQRRIKEIIAVRGEQIALPGQSTASTTYGSAVTDAEKLAGLARSVDMEWLDCAACGECGGENDTSASHVLADKTICSVDSTNR